MDWPLFDFVFACLIMGLGIGTDVAIATAMRVKQLQSTRTILFWVIGVSLTHTLFPMIGYLLTYFSIQIVPLITPLVGLIASYCIARFLWQEFKDMTQATKDCGEERQFLITLGLILAVSWDALWSGPAKSAQVIGWPELMVWGSFILVGVMVSAAAICSLYLSQKLGANVRVELAGGLKSFGEWLQYSIISYFGLLALLRYTLQLSISWWQLLVVSGVVIYVCLEVVAFLKAGKVSVTVDKDIS